MRDGSASESQLRVVASGGLEIWCGDERVDPRIPQKAALLIAYVVDQASPVSRARIAGLLWSDHTDEQARSSLRVALTRTRQHVPQLHADRSHLWLDGEVDFDLAEIESGPDAAVLTRHRGDAFAGIEAGSALLFDEWISQRREEHRTLLLRQLGHVVQKASEGRRWDEAATIARRMIDVEPWNEAAHRHLITALAATEGRSSALAAFDRCIELLNDEFGVSPDDETERLASAIRDGDLPTPPAAAASDETGDRTVMWRLLGDVAVVIGDEVHDLGGQHRRSVMARLAMNAPERCSLDELVEAVWGDDPPHTAKQAVQRHVRDLRALAPEVAARIERVPDGFRLQAVPSEVDAIDVRSSIASARSSLRHGELEAAASELREAIGRWDGGSLGGVTRHGRLGTERAALDELRLGAIEDLVEAELALGRHREIASEVEAFAMEHPSRERSWANLMLARSRTGRRAEAVAAYQQYCDALADDGLSPSQSIAALHRQIVEEAPAVRAEQWSSSAETTWTLPATTFSVPLPATFDRSSLVPLAGRESELRQLGSAFEAAGSERASTIFVGGEPGIGKTRLAAELAKVAHDAGAAVLYGRCDNSLGVPFQAWREALAPLADHIPPHIARRHLDRFGPSLRLLIPSLVDRVGSEDDPEAAVGDGSQQELLFRATTSLLGDVAQRRPLVVMIDDMQWAHDATLDLTRHVARNAGTSILLLCLYRTTEVTTDDPLHRLVVEVEQGQLGSVLLLEGLDAGARTQLVEAVLGEVESDVASQVAAKVAEQTGGNPFFMTEVLRSIEEGGSGASLLSGPSGMVVPPTVQRVVAERVSRLGDDVAATLRAASVHGREFDLDVLSLAIDWDEDDVLGDVEVALAAGLLTDAPLGRDRFAFAHDLLHQTLAAELSESRRCRLHGRIARAMEDLRGPDLGDQVALVARHLVAAEDRSLLDHTIQRCREAGRHAADKLAPSEAAQWFELALERSDPSDLGEQARLLVELGVQQRNAAAAEHRTTLIEAGRLAQSIGDTETLIEATLANSRGMNAHVWELDLDRIEMLRASLAALDEVDSAPRAELLAALANEQWDDDHREEAERFYREAIDIARRAGDPVALARVLVRASRARNFKLEREEMTAASDEVRALAEQIGRSDPLLLANCLTTVLNTSIRLGLADETRAAIEAICAVADELPLPMFTLPAHLARCLDAGLRGDIAAYEQASVETYEHATAIGDDEAIFMFEGQMYYTAYLRGDLAPILDFSIQVMNERPEVGLYRAVCTLMHVEAGKPDGARRLLDGDVAAGIEPSVDMFQIQALVAWADAAATLEHEPACEQLYDALIGLTTEMSGHLVQVGEPIDISLGRLASVLGRFDDAAVHFDRAEHIAQGFGAAWMEAKTAISRAEMLVRAGLDSEGAVELARQADEIARRNDFRNIAVRAATILQS